ncbi:DEAD/DEAH box helicase [Pseudoflavonifractor hominis]|uniref:DEAD/DEAH box helicase family protein n=1 Tax=Pseudoflavonifractor hominis TaxID=2763059 RepID=A0ABR7HSV4_9FIRM|nr:DEAD/DEAH box helicase family protein [Pseudoflavonifractor hominis]MBC5730583.1 DEAD/DEAH box helicase family protein [Pseudoflavonifractor hominis]
MKVNLISFQDKAVKDLRVDIADALDNYRRRKKTQVVSLQAPTGAGKTIIAAGLIEDIYFGSTLADGTTFDEQPEAIFVWLSDSPELNAQSKQKIELKTSKLRFGQCVTIAEDSFDMEMLEDGHVYFLNTQKISRNGKLTQHSDDRQYTIWETLDNTIQNKADRLYFIIDEAHRGAKSKREAGTDTTIMQRFIKGYEYTENGIKRKMRAMPVILGISATSERFNTLVGNTTNVGLQKYVITADEVRSSGLLKDRIVITYPEDLEKNNDIVLLEAAVEEWLKKCKRWYQYTSEQHYANVDPVLVVQVCQGHNGALSDTNLEDVLAKIEEKVGTPFKHGEVAHCFGEGTTLELNGLTIPHVKASEIADDHKIKVVFFKEALSTGWDCPRAETMMSFAVRNDPTYIAQLLGRMVRTPLQMRVMRDEFLNDVKLYLPHFNKDTVKKVVEELQSNEGGEIPTEINGESLEEPTYVTWTVHTPRHARQAEPDPNQIDLFDHMPGNSVAATTPADTPAAETAPPQAPAASSGTGTGAPEYIPPKSVTAPVPSGGQQSAPAVPTENILQGKQLEMIPEFDRVEIIDFINAKGYLNYLVRQDRINDYLKSLLDLATLLTHNVIYQNARNEVIDDIVGLIRSYIEELHRTGRYDALADQVLQFKLSVQVFDPFGKALEENYFNDFTLMSETDLDRQVRNADARLGRYGFPNIYGSRYFDEENPNAHKIDCVLFAADESCRAKLGEYAKNKLREFSGKYRVAVANKSDACKRKYREIMADSAVVSEQIFAIPENIYVKEDPDGKEYENHLLAAPDTGIAKIKLNGWEADLIDEEARRPDFVCWLRNPVKASWALCLPYDINNEKKSFYPDFLIVRRDPAVDYVVDILEPHGNQYADNLPKAKALAAYAKAEERIGRIQLIHKITGAGNKSRFVRLDLTDISVRDKVLRAASNEELDHIFETDGLFE